MLKKILSSPLINLDDLKPSFEEVDETVDENLFMIILKTKNCTNKKAQSLLV